MSPFELKLELGLELVAELKQTLPQAQKEVPQLLERPQRQAGVQQAVGQLNVVAPLLVKMNARAEALQTTEKKNTTDRNKHKGSRNK